MAKTETGVDETGDDDAAAYPEVGVGEPASGDGFVADEAGVVVYSEGDLEENDGDDDDAEYLVYQEESVNQIHNIEKKGGGGGDGKRGEELGSIRKVVNWKP